MLALLIYRSSGTLTKKKKKKDKRPWHFSIHILYLIPQSVCPQNNFDTVKRPSDWFSKRYSRSYTWIHISMQTFRHAHFIHQIIHTCLHLRHSNISSPRICMLCFSLLFFKIKCYWGYKYCIHSFIFYFVFGWRLWCWTNNLLWTSTVFVHKPFCFNWTWEGQHLKV